VTVTARRASCKATISLCQKSFGDGSMDPATPTGITPAESPVIPLSTVTAQLTVPTDPNPWDDTSNTSNKAEEPPTPEERPLHTPDPSLLDHSFSEGFEAGPSVTIDLKPSVPDEVLTEFDPLANPEEVAAREAWESAEGHPPPPRTPSPTPPPPPLKDIPAAQQLDTPQSPSSSVFPSFSALARSITSPLRSRSRPGSMDIARPVPSPSTLSAFVEQQQQRQAPEQPAASDSTSGRSTPGTSSSSDAAKADPPFDFQKFLDQMKTRNAEIVARYLKSCVAPPVPRCCHSHSRLLVSWAILRSARSLWETRSR
jgi:hypothetical protein